MHHLRRYRWRLWPGRSKIEERDRTLGDIGRAIPLQRRDRLIERRLGRAIRVVLAPENAGCGGAHKRGAGNPATAMPRQIAGDLATADRVADQRDLAQVELCQQRREVIGQRVELIAAPGIIRAAVAAPVVCDAAQTLLRQRRHLVLPHVAANRPAARKHHRPPGAPIAIVKARAIARFDEWHDMSFSSLEGSQGAKSPPASFLLYFRTYANGLLILCRLFFRPAGAKK